MRNVSLLLIGSLLAGCAGTPPVRMNYYLATSTVHARVIRTLACDASNIPVLANTVTMEVLHSADPGAPRNTDLWLADRALADSELKTEFYSDGRLKAVNATTTGVGKTVIETAIKLVQLAGEAPQRATIESVCKNFKTAFADKTLTLTFDVRDNLSPLRQIVPILPEAPGEYQYNKYAVLFGDLCLRFGQSHVPPKPAQTMGSGAYPVTVKARQPALLEAAVSAGPQANCTKSDLWSGLIEVGQLGQEYEIPIPAAKPFGKK